MSHGISGASERLLESRFIIEQPRCCKTLSRCVNLNSQQIFDALVSLYTSFFQTNCDELDGLAAALDSSDAQSVAYTRKLLASIYISHWFIDLYISNRDAVSRSLECFDMMDLYSNHDLHYHSNSYDSYLAALNAHIRPTLIKLGNVNMFYVPVICKEPDFKKENPFGIAGFVLNYAVFHGLRRRLEVGRFSRMHMAELCHEKCHGRPSWIFDWHDGYAYAWFPQEGNYSRDDLTVAFILSVPCSPHLGPTDTDEWQYWPLGTEKKEEDWERIHPQNQYGIFEPRVLEEDEWVVPESLRALSSDFLPTAQKKRHRKDPESRMNVEVVVSAGCNSAPSSIKRFRLVDYLYCKLVCVVRNRHTCSAIQHMQYVAFLEITAPACSNLAKSHSCKSQLEMQQPGIMTYPGISSASELLYKSNFIFEDRMHGKSCSKSVNLNTQQIFDALVSLYTWFFENHLAKLDCLAAALDISDAQSDKSSQKLLASVYISHWFIDLYVSNRNVVRKSYTYGDMRGCYPNFDLHHQSYSYDSFLATLNAHIRSTRIKVGNTDTLYVPVISIDSDFKKENPFGIAGFVLNSAVFQCLMSSLEAGVSSRMRMVQLCSEDVHGKPSWLFDWHERAAYAWFPQEGNYSRDDLTVAFILSVPCSPHLGPADTDEWQYLPVGAATKESLRNSERICPQSQHGFFEARVLETDEWVIPEPLRALISDSSPPRAERNKRKNSESRINVETVASAGCPGATPSSIKRFRLVDYLYWNQVCDLKDSPVCADINCMRYDAFLKIVLMHMW